MKSRTQGSRPRTQKNFEARTNPLEDKAEDTGASVLQKKRLQKFFSGDLKKKDFKIFFQAKKIFKKIFLGDLHLSKTKKGLHKFFVRFLAVFNKISTVQKIVLSSSRGQGNFRLLRLRGQGEGLQNVSSRTPSLICKKNGYDSEIIERAVTQAIRFLAVVQIKKTRFCYFRILQKQQKRVDSS